MKTYKLSYRDLFKWWYNIEKEDALFFEIMHYKSLKSWGL